ncbi:MAG: inositol monophosphatase [Armatimonadetes bacterium]|jgi:myo-inositol-1(or 4)-monophosphatase|nr:inositol monophosphatase [Armatimonadota bacterium]
MNREFVSGLAVEAGNLLVRHLGARIVRVKFGTDIVTEADEAAERFIREEVRRHYPGHRVTGEEYGSSEGEAEWEWVVDPLDGTVNFARGNSYFAVSIGLVHRGEVRIGVVYRPLTRELFAAERGGGATLNGEPLSVSQVDRVEESIVILDWTRRHSRHDTFALTERLFFAASKVRSFGSAALDLCSVAAGQLEAFIHPGLSAWDFAAGHLILTEAGGTITTLAGEPRSIEAGSVVATNGKIHPEVLSLLTLPPG